MAYSEWIAKRHIGGRPNLKISGSSSVRRPEVAIQHWINLQHNFVHNYRFPSDALMPRLDITPYTSRPAVHVAYVVRAWMRKLSGAD